MKTEIMPLRRKPLSWEYSTSHRFLASIFPFFCLLLSEWISHSLFLVVILHLTASFSTSVVDSFSYQTTTKNEFTYCNFIWNMTGLTLSQIHFHCYPEKGDRYMSTGFFFTTHFIFKVIKQKPQPYGNIIVPKWCITASRGKA